MKFNFGDQSYIMGILNVTPDSFSDGGKYNVVNKAVNRARAMVKEGADIIDIGGESTRPGAVKVDSKEELKRIVPVLSELLPEIEVPVSVDTYKARVAEKVLDMGVEIINDVRGLQDNNELPQIIGDYEASVVIMHNSRLYESDKNIIDSIKDFFDKSLEIALKNGIKEKNIILDPGIGFGISQAENFEIIKRLEEIKVIGFPLLLGTSRKSMLGNILELPASKRVEGTLATTVIGIEKGADIFRVHDVKENKRAATVADLIYKNKEERG